MSDIKPRAGRSPKVRLDWKAYFIEFCQVHGEPVEHKGRLIFRDGWSYSISDFAGPEMPPPSDNDELDRMTEKYWQIRLRMLNILWLKMTHERDTIKKVAYSKSLPLWQTTVIEVEGDDGTSRRRKGYKKLDLTALETKIDWVATDVEECKQHLKQLQEYRARVNPPPDTSAFHPPAPGISHLDPVEVASSDVAGDSLSGGD